MKKLATTKLVEFVNGLSDEDKHYMDLVMADLQSEYGSGFVTIGELRKLIARKKESRS